MVDFLPVFKQTFFPCMFEGMSAVHTQADVPASSSSGYPFSTGYSYTSTSSTNKGELHTKLKLEIRKIALGKSWRNTA